MTTFPCQCRPVMQNMAWDVSCGVTAVLKYCQNQDIIKRKRLLSGDLWHPVAKWVIMILIEWQKGNMGSKWHLGQNETLEVQEKSTAWWRYPMEAFSALLALCAGNSPVTGEFQSQRPVTRSFDVFFDLRVNKSLSRQSRRWWFGTLSRSLWRHCNGNHYLAARTTPFPASVQFALIESNSQTMFEVNTK